MRFTTTKSPFWLKRKSDRLPKDLSWSKKRHYIISVEEVDPRDTVCIITDGPSHLFLAGEGCIPTHNSRSMYPHFYIKSNLYRIDALAGERNGLGVPVITMPKGATEQDRGTAFNFVTKLSAHEMTGLVLPFGGTFESRASKANRGTS